MNLVINFVFHRRLRRNIQSGLTRPRPSNCLSAELNRTSPRTELVGHEREMGKTTFVQDSASVGNQGAYQSSSDFDLDSDEYDFDPEVTLESIQKSQTISFSICASYTNLGAL